MQPGARARGVGRLSLEARADNAAAIAFYRRAGYAVRRTLAGYYDDGTDALKLEKSLAAAVQLDVPYYAQTLDFTCGPACVMMAMKHFDPGLRLNRTLELRLWKEATLIFMTSGLGGCGPFGLAVAARRRGFDVRLALSSHRIPFVSSVRSAEKRDVIRLVHRDMKREAQALGVEVGYGDFGLDALTAALDAGVVPIVLISIYRLHRERTPHWVVLTGHDAGHITFHDPYQGVYAGRGHSPRHVRVAREEFSKIKRYGKQVTKSVVFVAAPAR